LCACRFDRGSREVEDLPSDEIEIAARPELGPPARDELVDHGGSPAAEMGCLLKDDGRGHVAIRQSFGGIGRQAREQRLCGI
jgi:hypothetical protein